MKERPILFSSPMVRAILAGNKTQTRRVVKQQPFDRSWSKHDHNIVLSSGRAENGDEIDGLYAISASSGGEWYAKCPYGQVGDRLWVRETCRAEELENGLDGVRYLADNHLSQIGNTFSASIEWLKLYTYRGMEGATVPTIHMSRLASQILLEIVNVRVERLQNISRVECMQEGCPFPNMAKGENPRNWFSALWESINGAGSWSANPWVWVVEFKRVEAK